MTIIDFYFFLKTRFLFDNSSKHFQFGLYILCIDIRAICKYILIAIIIVVPIFFVLCCAADIDIESFIFSNSNPSSPPSGQEPFNSTSSNPPSGQEPSNSAPSNPPSGQEPSNSAPSNPPSGQEPSNSQSNGEVNGDNGGSASDSDSDLGTCPCCGQYQGSNGPCGCPSNCSPEVMSYDDNTEHAFCCDCRGHRVNYLCRECSCLYCPNCYSSRQN